MKSWALLLSFTLLFIVACTNSDDYLFSESESTTISISAKMAPELDSINQQSKVDTIRSGDTLTFIADINPSRSIRMQRYYWTMDDELFATEFSFRKGFVDPGHHSIALVLVDIFGDTITDTLNVWVGNPPILDDSVFIPRQGSQGIPSSGGISFAWNAYDPDSLYSLYYHFTLSSQSKDLEIDTIVNEPFFTYQKSLEPLQSYYWQVSAYNELNMVSKNSISGKFFTKGTGEESGLLGEIRTSGYNNHAVTLPITANIVIKDTSGKQVKTTSITANTGSSILFRIAPIEPGKYYVITSIPDYPDYVANIVSSTVLPGEMQELPLIKLNDTLAPRIQSLNSISEDTLNYADTLKFVITDGGDTLSNENVQAYLEKQSIPITRTSGDTFSVQLPPSAKSLTYRLLTLKISDLSGNDAQKTFYINPELQWFECNSDTNLYNNEVLEIFIRDTNPLGLEPELFYFDLFNGGDTIAVYANNQTEHAFKIMYNMFEEESNPVRTGIRYTNGIVKWKNWNITRIFETRGTDE